MSNPQRLLEVTINSARDLPPMAQMLRTFVVAWVNPENKLSTRVDRHGHTNPTWNDKLSFRVDDDFLRSESSTVMMVIYNLAWLRDLPMGTTNLMIGQLLKTTHNKNQALRNITLHIRRPTGHLQGTLNVSVNIVGDPLPTSTPETQLLSASKTPSKQFNQQKQETLAEKFDHLELENKIGGKNKNKIKISQPKQETLSEVFESIDLERKLGLEKNVSRGNSSKTNSIKNASGKEISSLDDSTIWIQKSETGTKSRTMSSNDSLFPQMKPFPSEVASDIKRGYYSQSPGQSTCNDIFDNWTEAGNSERNTWRSKSSRWGVDEQLARENIFEKQKLKQKQKKSSSEKGLLSCFGNLMGFECNVVCGSKNGKKKRKYKYESKDPVFASSEQNLRMFKF